MFTMDELYIIVPLVGIVTVALSMLGVLAYKEYES